jgi:uncharacterized protein YcbX
VQGRVVSLHRWPFKSMGGEPVPELAVQPRGAEGDRAYAAFDEFKGAPRRLTAREAPRLLLWHATAAGVTAPDGRTFDHGDPALPAALSEDLGRAVEVRHDPALQQDLPDSLLVTFAASHLQVEDELGPLDPRRWRTNIHVEGDAPPFAEADWEGRTLRVGDAELRLLHPCARCVIPTRDPDTAEKMPQLLKHLTAQHAMLFGINARATGAATIRVGDPVALQ